MVVKGSVQLVEFKPSAGLLGDVAALLGDNEAARPLTVTLSEPLKVKCREVKTTSTQKVSKGDGKPDGEKAKVAPTITTTFLDLTPSGLSVKDDDGIKKIKARFGASAEALAKKIKANGNEIGVVLRLNNTESHPFVAELTSDDLKKVIDPQFKARFSADMAGTAAQEVYTYIKSHPMSKAFETTKGRGLAGVITSLSLDYGMGSTPWEIEEAGSRAPMAVDIQMSFEPIHDMTPGLDHGGRIAAPTHPVGVHRRNPHQDQPSPLDPFRAKSLNEKAAEDQPDPPEAGGGALPF